MFMAPTTYAAAVVRRWHWVLLGGLVGALLGLGLAPSPSYETATELYVEVARVDAQEDPAYAALVRDRVLPSLVAVADAARANPQLTGTGATAELVENTSVLRITASAPSAELAAARASAAADAVRAQAETYLAADGTPVLTVATVTPAEVSPHPASRGRMTTGVLGLAAGAVLAVLAGGLAELARPRAPAGGGQVAGGELPSGATPRAERLALLLTAADGTGRRGAWRMPSVWCAVLALAAVGADLRLPLALTSGLLVTVLLLPVWLPALRWYRGGVPLAVLVGVGLVSGLLLARRAAVEHGFVPLEAATTAGAVLTGLGTIGLLLWARTLLPVRPLGVVFGVGMLVHGLLRVSQSANPFKFELSLPLTVIVLSLVVGRRRPGVSVAALGILGLLNIVNDARSAFAFCLAAAALVLWQARPTGTAGRAVRWGRGAVLVGIAGAAAYALLTDLLLSGALGSGLQARTATQVAQSGSLLLSGRPEWTATWALMREQPLGFGLGTIPSPADVHVAEAGLAVVNDPTAEGYLHNYLLAGRFELHSVVADLWTNLGPAGLVLGLTMAGLTGAAAATLVARRRAPALVCFLVPTALWYLAFGPLPTDFDVVSLALGLVLLPAAARPSEGAHPPAASTPDVHPAGAGSPPAGV
jgi:hypothetical protein